MQQPYRSVWTELLDTPFRQAWIDAGELKTRFIQAGDPSKPPLVMLHGTAGSLENFAANIAAHARHFNCIAFDMIGSGMTDKPDYDYETEHYVTQRSTSSMPSASGKRPLSAYRLGRVSQAASPSIIRKWWKSSSCFRLRPIFQQNRYKMTLSAPGLQQPPIRHGTASSKSSKACFTIRARYGMISLRRDSQSTVAPT